MKLITYVQAKSQLLRSRPVNDRDALRILLAVLKKNKVGWLSECGVRRTSIHPNMNLTATDLAQKSFSWKSEFA
jgi:hypothetical protein